MKIIIVLGAAVWAEGASPTLRRRCDCAARLWHQGGCDAVVACGGLGKFAPTEAVVIRDLLVNAGVPQSSIHLEDQSTNTYQNLSFALPILSAIGAHAAIIVTDHYHRPRVLMVARAIGMRATTTSPSWKGTHLSTQIRQYFRECLALPAYAVRLAFRKK